MGILTNADKNEIIQGIANELAPIERSIFSSINKELGEIRKSLSEILDLKTTVDCIEKKVDKHDIDISQLKRDMDEIKRKG